MKFIECLKFYNVSLKELVSKVSLYPQVMKSAPIAHKKPLNEVKKIQEKLKEVEQELGEKGRVVLRYSGTENLVRVMVEGENEYSVGKLCGELVITVQQELAAI